MCYNNQYIAYVKEDLFVIYWIIAAAILAFVALLILITSFVCFVKIFLSRRKPESSEFPIPDGDEYVPYHSQMVEWIKEARSKEHRDVSVVSYDGLTLRGKYYECKKGAPIEILFHGYKGTGERDLSGGVFRCAALEHNALVIDHRASGHSDGRVITFGAKESRDVLTWVDFVINNIDAEAKIIITGISMGAATVMTAATMELPENVVGVLADCGYTSTKDIVKKVMSDMKLPANLLYPFARLGAMIFGGFDPDASSPIESMKKCRLPVIFFHGDADYFVPCYMSEENYNACAAEHKRLVIIPGAAHGLAFPVDREKYLAELEDFFAPYL